MSTRMRVVFTQNRETPTVKLNKVASLSKFSATNAEEIESPIKTLQ